MGRAGAAAGVPRPCGGGAPSPGPQPFALGPSTHGVLFFLIQTISMLSHIYKMSSQ